MNYNIVQIRYRLESVKGVEIDKLGKIKEIREMNHQIDQNSEAIRYAIADEEILSVINEAEILTGVEVAEIKIKGPKAVTATVGNKQLKMLSRDAQIEIIGSKEELSAMSELLLKNIRNGAITMITADTSRDDGIVTAYVDMRFYSVKKIYN